MKALIQALFPEGQRKVMVNLIALAIGLAIFLVNGHQIPDNMVTMLLGLTAIFNGGNILEHLSEVFKGLKGSKIGQIIEDVMPGDQGLGEAGIGEVVANAARARELAQSPVSQAHVDMAADIASQVVKPQVDALSKQLAALTDKLNVQAQNQSKLVAFINGIAKKAVPAAEEEA